ncbi:MAG: response regulator transcription factor [Ignavibacteria bacterium]|nr:response regulator transcription factor [Ignavibacteria bacterium]
MPTILFVEDEYPMRVALEDAFKHCGYEVASASDGEAGLKLVEEKKPDLVILDVMLPHMDGFEVCKQLRQQGFMRPILMLTARSQEVDKVIGLELGADDYVTKPFGDRELLARVKALLRRASHEPSELVNYRFGTVDIDFTHFIAEKNGRSLRLTSTEFSLLHLLISQKGKVLTREELLNKVWGYEFFPQSRTVDNHILRLRQKLEDDPNHPGHILTIHGLGYKFVD